MPPDLASLFSALAAEFCIATKGDAAGEPFDLAASSTGDGARVDALIADIRRSPFAGIGKPEPLRHEWQGYWSRRITAEHRLVYRVEAGRLYILQARYHY